MTELLHKYGGLAVPIKMVRVSRIEVRCKMEPYYCSQARVMCWLHAWSLERRFSKMRLHDALKQLPSMDSSGCKRDVVIVSAGEKVWTLARANREVHICANVLLQQFRWEEWKRIRWHHAIAVAQRWIDRLGLESNATGNLHGR
jgi:hypothetical protein